MVNSEQVRRGVLAEPDPSYWGGVRRRQLVQDPECLGESLSDWGDS